MRHWNEFAKVRAAGAYFFACPGLAYGMFTSRLPAFKMQTQADAAHIGLILLCVGGASFLALLTSRGIIAHYGSKAVLIVGSVAVALTLIAMSVMDSPLLLGGGAIFFGLAIGYVDVAMNTQGVLIERQYQQKAMSSMHAANSFGAVLGALSGAVFASQNIGILPHVLSLQIIYLAGQFFAKNYLISGVGQPIDIRNQGEKNTRQVETLAPRHSIPLFITFCGFLSACAYATEGAVAEWGSLLLYEEKHTLKVLRPWCMQVFPPSWLCVGWEETICAPASVTWPYYRVAVFFQWLG